MAEEANKKGLNFNLESIKKTPNTVLSHLLINLAEKENKQNQIKEKIYQSYFIEGLIMTFYSMFAYFIPNKKNNISSIVASFFLSFGFVLVSTFFTAFPIWMLVFLFK